MEDISDISLQTDFVNKDYARGSNQPKSVHDGQQQQQQPQIQSSHELRQGAAQIDAASLRPGYQPLFKSKTQEVQLKQPVEYTKSRSQENIAASSQEQDPAARPGIKDASSQSGGQRSLYKPKSPQAQKVNLLMNKIIEQNAVPIPDLGLNSSLKPDHHLHSGAGAPEQTGPESQGTPSQTLP